MRAAAWNGWIGIAIAIFGIALRFWANKTLGEFYTRTLRLREKQSIVQHGPYAMLRHPGYAGVILMWFGAAWATSNWIAVIIAGATMFTVYHYRIQAEEAMLLTAGSKEYGEYRARTWKLIPFIY